MFKASPELVERVQSGDGALNVEPVLRQAAQDVVSPSNHGTLNRAEGASLLLQGSTLRLRTRRFSCEIRVMRTKSSRTVSDNPFVMSRPALSDAEGNQERNFHTIGA
jgi:hypothetical protein